MFKVSMHGDRRDVYNPIDNKPSDMTLIRFTEEGRGGTGSTVAASSDFLTRAIGKESGLTLVRTHSQLVKTELVDSDFPLEKTFNGYINRSMHSIPQVQRQLDNDVMPRNINDRPTYFLTWFDSEPKDDLDLRETNEWVQINRPDVWTKFEEVKKKGQLRFATVLPHQ